MSRNASPAKARERGPSLGRQPGAALAHPHAPAAGRRSRSPASRWCGPGTAASVDARPASATSVNGTASDGGTRASQGLAARGQVQGAARLPQAAGLRRGSIATAKDVIDERGVGGIGRAGAADQPVGEVRVGLLEQPFEREAAFLAGIRPARRRSSAPAGRRAPSCRGGSASEAARASDRSSFTRRVRGCGA